MGLGSLCHSLTKRGMGMQDLGAQGPEALVGRGGAGGLSDLQSLYTSGSSEVGATDCKGMAVVPPELCMVNGSLFGFRVVFKASLGVDVAALLASTTPSTR